MPDKTLHETNVIASLISSFVVVVLLLNTNILFVKYANITAQSQDNPLLTTSSIPIILAKIKYETKFTIVDNPPNTKYTIISLYFLYNSIIFSFVFFSLYNFFIILLQILFVVF